jgi:hypothetical protein
MEILLILDDILRGNVLKLLLFVGILEGVLVAIIEQADAAEELLHGLGHGHFIDIFVTFH